MTSKHFKHFRSLGFTLIEVMLAMAILAVALVAVFQLQSQSIAMSGRSRFETTATLLAMAKVAEIEAMDITKAGSESGGFGDDFPGYLWSVSAEDTDVENLIRFDVTVTNDRLRRNNNYRLTLFRFVLK